MKDSLVIYYLLMGLIKLINVYIGSNSIFASLCG